MNETVTDTTPAASTTKVGPGSVETAPGNSEALAVMNAGGQTGVAPAHQQMNQLDGSYKPAEAKIYSSFLKVSYGVGFGAEGGYAPGSLVLDKKDLLVGPKVPIIAVIVQAAGFWREWKEYDGKNFPKDFATEVEARKAGFRTQQPPRGSGLPLRNCAPAVDLALFVRKPITPTSSMAFTCLLNGDPYAPVRFTVDKGQYTSIERTLDNLPKMDAANRGKAPDEGRLNAYFVTFTTHPETFDRRDGTKGVKVNLYLNLLLDKDNKPILVPEKWHQDLASVVARLQAAVQAPALPEGGDEDSPAF